jgi:hypothetical protein
MGLALTKHEIGWFRTGPDPETGIVLQYRVEGLPATQEASIADFPYRGWRILRWKNGVRGVWYGEYESADQALNALQRQIEYESLEAMMPPPQVRAAEGTGGMSPPAGT